MYPDPRTSQLPGPPTWAPLPSSPPTAPYPGQQQWTPPPGFIPSGGGAAGPSGPNPFDPPVRPSAPRRHSTGLLIAVAAIVSVIATLAGVGLGAGLANVSTDTARTPSATPGPLTGRPFEPPTRREPLPTVPGSTAPRSNSGDTTIDAEAVAAKVTRGLVHINTRLGYQQSAAAGSGMILTSSGTILTNNHVIEGSTEIVATVVETGKQYTARVVGTAPSDDVAVLQLEKASGLSTIEIGDSSKLAVGDPVVALGNAGGKGGEPHVVAGNIQALDQDITASDQSGGNAERLTGLIQVSAQILPGDSGGALANADGRVIGMNTAASGGNRFESAGGVGFAIPTAHAMSIAKLINDGKESERIHIGLPALLGVQVAPSTSSNGPSGDPFGNRSPSSPDSSNSAPTTGALVAGVASDSPAAKIGLTQGDTITSIDGQAVTTPESLTTIIRKYQPGDEVKVSWTDQSGADRSGTTSLITGPAD